MSIIKKHVVEFTTLLLGILIPASVSAQVSLTTPSSVWNVRDISVLIPRLFDIVVGVAGILFVVLLLLGGVQYLTSLGEEEAVTKARKLMLNAGIGLVIVLSSWAVGNYVLKLLGINVSLTGGTVQNSQTPVGGGATQTPSSGGGSPTTPTSGGGSSPASGSQLAALQQAQAEVLADQQAYDQKTASEATALTAWSQALNETPQNTDKLNSLQAKLDRAHLETIAAQATLATAKAKLAKLENVSNIGN